MNRKAMIRIAGAFAFAALFLASCSNGLGSPIIDDTEDEYTTRGPYTVIFESEGATVAASPSVMTVPAGSTTLSALPSEPQKADWNFAGWRTERQGGGTPFTRSTEVTGDITLYAHWTQDTVYTVRFDSRGGSDVASEYVVASETAASPADPSRPGYRFEGWYADAQLETEWDFASGTVTSDTTLYAKWSLLTYTVTYTLNGGTINGGNPAEYTVESVELVLGNPFRSAYEFSGWFADEDLTVAATSIPSGSTGNLRFYAAWTPVIYAITYSLDGGVNAAANPAHYTIETASFALKTPVKTGHAFDGWYSDAGFTVPVTSVAGGGTGPITLYAKWIPSYTVTFDSQNATIGAGPGNKTVAAPATTVDALPNPPVKTGYVFSDWWTSENGGGSQFLANTTVTGDTTVYAKWTQVQYQITYNLDGGTNGVGNPSYYTIESREIEFAPASRSGYSFVAWFADAAFSRQISSIPQGSTGTVTLYAQWWNSSSSAVAKPSFSPAGGVYESDQRVTLSSATAGAAVYYSTDGVTWNLYSGPIAVAGHGTHTLLNAYAVKTGMGDSEVSAAEYTIDKVVGTPTVSVTAGSYSADPALSITSATNGASFYYTTDGSEPTLQSTRYSGQISLAQTGSVHIRVLAVKDGMTSSQVDAGVYILDPNRVSTPQFNVRGGDFSTPQTVTIGSLTADVTIRYTLDGSTPSRVNGTVYSGPITINSTRTLKAVAYRDGMDVSTVQSAEFRFPVPSLGSGFLIAATGQAKKVNVTWTAVQGAASYNVYWAKGDTVSTSTGTKVTGVSSGWVLTGLTNGWNYSFVVTAVNANGESSSSVVVTVKPHL